MNRNIINFCGKTDPGLVRDHNEDKILIVGSRIRETNTSYSGGKIDPGRKGLIFTVADGMGGASAGEIASQLATSVIKKYYQNLNKVPANPESILKKLLQEIHRTIKKQANKNAEYKGMGTTIVLGWLIDNILHVVWVGDSRCYILEPTNEKDFVPFTDDHSLVWNMVKAGELSAEQARIHEQSNIILQSLGGDLDKPEPEYKKFNCYKNCRILFCSDGLNGMLSDQGIQQILLFEKDPCNTCEKLIQSAKNAGGKDNISVLVIDILDKVERVDDLTSLNVNKKKKKLKWPLMVIFVGIIFLCLYLIDHVLLSYNKPLNDTISQFEAPLSSLQSSKKRERIENKSTTNVSLNKPVDEPDNKLLDSLQFISAQVKDQITEITNALEGKIKETDSFAYNKISIRLEELKEVVYSDTVNIKDIAYNEQINKLNQLKHDLDSIHDEIIKINKLKKLKK